MYFDPDKLWRIMVRKRISPSALIAELGVEPRTLGVWLVGAASPRQGHLFQIARALGTTQESLMSEQDTQ